MNDVIINDRPFSQPIARMSFLAETEDLIQLSIRLNQIDRLQTDVFVSCKIQKLKVNALK